MKKCLFLFLITLVLALAFGTLSVATGAAAQDNAKTDSKAEKPNCLACHGPFDKLAAKTADHVMPSGEKTSLHKYIPHADQKDIPDCTECHTPHPVPIEDKSAVVKATVDFCYVSCHHAQNFQPCKNCH